MTKPSIEARLEALERRQELQDDALLAEKQARTGAEAFEYYCRAVAEASAAASRHAST